MSSSLRGYWFSPLLTPSRTIAKLSRTSLSEIQAYSAISLSWVERVTCVRVLESFDKSSEHPILEHLLISLKFFEASFTLGTFAPRRLEVAWKLQSEIVEAPRSLYYPCKSSGNLLISRVRSLDLRPR
jgi:hypothetical protein